MPQAVAVGTTSSGVAGVAQLVERKPSKLDVAGSSPVSRSCRTRKSYVRAAPDRGHHNEEDEASSVGASGSGRRRSSWRLGASEKGKAGVGLSRVARVAQLVEHTLGKGEVTGSIPVASSDGAGHTISTLL